VNKKRLLLLIIMSVPLTVFAGVDCEKLNDAGEEFSNIVPDFGSGRDIVGKGRLQFYSAPHADCKMNGWFVVPGDILFAKFTFQAFTKVSFIQMKKGDREVTAWVFSSRLQENGKGIVPGNSPDSEEITILIRNGELAIAQRKFGSAIETCQSGLDAVGDAYWSKNIEDDSDMKLIAAGALRRDGKLENAAMMYCRVLAERLHLYNRKME
jgi:hypothetical protein